MVTDASSLIDYCLVFIIIYNLFFNELLVVDLYLRLIADVILLLDY